MNDLVFMTDQSTQNHQDQTKSNPNAVSIRIEPKAMAKAKFQRRHDFRIGSQPNYVDDDRTHLNRDLIDLRPLPEIQRENAAMRLVAGRTRKMKSNAAVITSGIITFGHIAQDVFNSLPIETQDQAFTELAYEIANRLDTTLEALVVHLDETAIHAHFMLRAYNNAGQPISDATRLGDMSALQDLAAEVMQRYAPDIERGQKKKARLESGANYADTLHRTVKELHNDLPQEKAMLEADIDALSQDIVEKEQSAQKTQAHLNQLKTKAELTEKERKREETYTRRLVTKQVAMALDIEMLENKKKELDQIIDQERFEICAQKHAAKDEREQAAHDLSKARDAKQSYEDSVTAIEAVLAEVENETLIYDPTTEKTTMKDPAPILRVSPKLRTKIVELAKRLAFIENSLFSRIFRLDEHIARVKTFLAREDVAPEARRDAEKMKLSLSDRDFEI